MRYSEDLVEEIRLRNDIVEVISGYVKLQRKGSSYFGLCPFHNEKSPSFSVSPGKQMYYCFGCGAGGNVFTFIMEYENYSFAEALKVLAERAGVELPKVDMSKESKARADEKSALLQIQKDAAGFYYYQLKTKEGENAYHYLRGRGLSEEIIKKFGLGYSGKFGGGLYKYLKEKRYSDELLKQSGLFQIDEKRGMYDKFWNRVIFPITDVNNRVIGFGGRVMGEAKPKYLNSPETKVFDKSRNLYGLNIARTSRKKNLIICEGYLDVISMHQAGFNNAVASLGTALTSQQASLMKRYTSEVLIVYDSDEAGKKAALRAIPLLKQAGLSSKVINLNPYKDPDDFVQGLGAEALEERLKNGTNSFMYQIAVQGEEYDMQDPQGKTDFFHATAARLLEFEDEIERNSYMEAIAATYHVEYDVLRKLVNKLALKGVGKTEAIRPKSGIARSKEKESGYEISQKLMLTWLATYPQIFAEVTKYISVDDFTTPLYQTIAKMLFEQYRQGDIKPAKILNHFTDAEEQTQAAAVFNATLPLDSEEERLPALKDIIYRMKESSHSYRQQTSDPNDMKAVMELMSEQLELEKLRNGNINLQVSF